MEICQLEKGELGIIKDLAYQIWPSTYSEILSQEQIDYMLNWMYNIETLEKNLENQHVYFAIYENAVPLGFIDLELDIPEPSWLKLQKIYVLPEKQKMGLGLALMQHAFSFADENNMKHITLQVNRSNKAVSFYKQLGFFIKDEQDFDIGKGYFMNDYIMQKDL